MVIVSVQPSTNPEKPCGDRINFATKVGAGSADTAPVVVKQQEILVAQFVFPCVIRGFLGTRPTGRRRSADHGQTAPRHFLAGLRAFEVVDPLLAIVAGDLSEVGPGQKQPKPGCQFFARASTIESELRLSSLASFCSSRLRFVLPSKSSILPE